jgi:protein CpxP
MTSYGTRATAMFSGRRNRLLMIGMLAALLGVIGLSAWAQPGPGGEGMGWHRHMEGGMGPGMFAGSPERVARMVDHALDGLNATEAQRSQIKQIATAAAADLRAQFQAGRGLRQRGLQILTAPTVDAAAAEQLRQQALQQHDQMSRRVTQALVEVANVLTPEQRAKVAERIKDRQARMEEHMKRMQRDEPRR